MAFSFCGCASFQDEVAIEESSGLYDKYMSFYAEAVSRGSVDGDSVLDPVDTIIPLDSPVNMIDVSALLLMNMEQLDSVESLIKSQYNIPELSLAEQQEREDYMYMMVQEAIDEVGGIPLLLDFMQAYTESGGGPDNLVALAPAGLNGLSETIYLNAAIYADKCMIPMNHEEARAVMCISVVTATIGTKYLVSDILEHAVMGLAGPVWDAIDTASAIIDVVTVIKEFYDCLYPFRQH